MANRRISGKTFKGAIIDTAPGASGFWTDPVRASEHKVPALFLSIAGIWNGTVRLQYREQGAPGWTTYKDKDGDVNFTNNVRQKIDDFTNCQYRAGVESGEFTSGAIRVRIEYHDGEYR
jgi:hypothetical protein